MAEGGSDWKRRQLTRKSRLRRLAGNIKKRLKTGWDKLISEKTKDIHRELTEELEEDFQPDFLSTCEATSKRLNALKRKYPDQVLFNKEKFLEAQKQFREKQILISAIGRHGSGKSTLLNALLDCRVLPMSTENETAVKIHIHNNAQHIPGPEEQQSEASPKLLITTDGEVIKEVNGAEEIYNELLTRNTSARTHAHDSNEYKILMAAPVLNKALPRWNVSLVDTPGFGEANTRVAKAACAAMSASSACVYVATSGSLGSTTDTDCFNDLYKKGMFKDGRLVIVLTRFDENYDEDCEVPTKEEAKQKAIDCVSSATNGSCLIQEDMVITVSGLWAHIAQELEKSASKPDATKMERLKKKAIRFLSTYPDQGKGQKETFGHLEKFSSQEIAEKLKEASGIRQLEGRMKDMALKCADTWISTMQHHYTCLLNESKYALLPRLTEDMDLHKQKEDRHFALMTHCNSFTESQDRLKEKARDTTSPASVFKALEQAYDDDLQKGRPEKRGKEVATELLNKFKEKCIIRIKDKKDFFGPEEFRQELQQFKEGVKQELQSSFNGSCSFLIINRKLTDFVDSLATAFEEMKQYANNFLCEEPCRPDELSAVPELKDSTTDFGQLSGKSVQASQLSASSGHVQQISTTDVKQLSTSEFSAQVDQPSALSEDLRQISITDEQCLSSESEELKLEFTQTLDEAMEVRNLGELKDIMSEIPTVNLSFWEKFMEWLRGLWSGTETKSQGAESGSCDGQCMSVPTPPTATESADKKREYRSVTDLDKFMTTVEKCIMKECDCYCKTVKPYVVQYFFTQYCERTHEKLTGFESKFSLRIKEKLKQLQELEGELDELEQRIEELETIAGKHLPKMIRHVQSTAEAFLKEDHNFL